MVVTPFDAPYEKATDFSERIARNQQLLIKEEAHFDRIVDASAGSYYIEHLTDALAQEGWKLFLKIEDEGGFLEACKKGIVQDDINATNVKRHGDAAKRKEFILGTNQFPNFTEKSEGKRAVDAKACCHGGECEAPFKGCGYLKKVAFADGIGTVPARCLSGSEDVEEVSLPSSVSFRMAIAVNTLPTDCISKSVSG